MLAALKSTLSNWVFRPQGRETGAVLLSQRRIFILPTRQGIGFAATLSLLLVGSINYNLSVGFVLTFLLTGMAIVSILHTFRNLAHLKVSGGRAAPVFAGEPASFELCLDNPSRFPRFAIGIRHPGAEVVWSDVPAGAAAFPALRLPSRERGILALGRFTLFTRYPLGLFYAWSTLELDCHCLVYPRPDGSPSPIPDDRREVGDAVEFGIGRDDFAGLRAYHSGDSLRHVAWKAVARGQGLLVKEFSGRAGKELWLDWDDLPVELDPEARLSRLARWVLDASASGRAYGLRLPSRVVAPGGGPGHRERCLEALALFNIDAAAG